MPANRCAHNGCNRDTKTGYNTYCNTHAQQFYRTKTTWDINSHRQPKDCLVPECLGKPQAKGLCHKHYETYIRGMIIYEGDDTRKCEYENCNRRHYAKGLCHLHYQAYKSIQYSQKIQELIDSVDLDKKDIER